MSNLPVSSRLKPPVSRIAKASSTKTEGILTPRSGLKPPSSTLETPQKNQAGLRQPLTKRSSASEPEKIEKRSNSNAGSALSTPRSKASAPQSKIGLQRPQQTPIAKREGLSTNLIKRQSSGSTSSLNKEPERPSLTREKTQESLKDVETGILFKIGDRVLVAGSKAGVIEYLGETKFAKGLWAGVKLDEASGKNDGCVAGVRYFECEPLHGVFSKPNRLHKINIVPDKKHSISDFKLDESNVLKIGDMVIVNGTKMGILRYLGPTEFAKGEWAGIELEEALGKNDGAVAGTRYFTCEMKYGLFAPSSKVIKSKKKQVLSKKPSLHSPETSLASAAKSVFNRTTSLNSENGDVPVHALSPSEKPSVSDMNHTSGSPIESLHMAVKKTPSNSQQVAANLQSALEEREREISKMLMERELEKAEKLKALDETTKHDSNVVHEQALKERDNTIKLLQDNLAKAKTENSFIQTKLDEEKKKYEDLQFMLEEEKITDDELKNHVKEDESKIRELSDKTEEKNKRIMELQKELREAHSDNLGHETKVFELRDELVESKTKIEHLRSNMATATDTSQNNAQQLETLLANVNNELDETRREVNKKNKQINELESKMSKEKELEDSTGNELKEKLILVEVEKSNAIEECKKMRNETNKVVEELTKLKNEKNEMESYHKSTVEKLLLLEKQYKDLVDENSMASGKKEAAAKANSLSLNAKILHLEDEVSEANISLSNLEIIMATAGDAAQEKYQQVETLLESVRKQLNESNEEVGEKKQLINELENRLNAQVARQKEIEKEVESLDQADKNLTLMKGAHRAELDALQSKANSMTETAADVKKKHDELVQNYKNEIKMIEESKRKEVQNLKDNMSATQSEKNNVLNECESLRSEKEKMLDELSRLQNDHSDVELGRSAALEKMQELEKKCKDLSEANVEITSERNDAIQLCEEQDQQMDIINKEKDRISQERDLLRKEKDGLSQKMISLGTQINNHSESSLKQGELQEIKESEIRSLKAQLDEAWKDNRTTRDTINILTNEKNLLESEIEAKVKEINRLQSEQLTVDRIGSEDMPKSPIDGDILENASTLLIRLHEAESKLSTIQTEKETAEEQMEFLNSVIVDLQNKNRKAQQTIALLEAGDDALLLHGLDSDSDEELMVKPKYAMRKFCDICDAFDKHDTDECPLQESGDDTGGVKHFGDREQERPYCGICEAFGHWSEDCDDEQTF